MLFAIRDGVDVGLAAFRRTHKWEQHRPPGHARGLRPGRRRRRPAGDAAPAGRLRPDGRPSSCRRRRPTTRCGSGSGPRSATEVIPADNLWLRLVDLEAALPLRSYDGECDVVVDLVDPLAPWQAGRWRIVVAGGEGRAERTDAAPDAALPVAALGSAYLGGTNLVALQRAGLLPERRLGRRHASCGARSAPTCRRPPRSGSDVAGLGWLVLALVFADEVLAAVAAGVAGYALLGVAGRGAGTARRGRAVVDLRLAEGSPRRAGGATAGEGPGLRVGVRRAVAGGPPRLGGRVPRVLGGRQRPGALRSARLAAQPFRGHAAALVPAVAARPARALRCSRVGDGRHGSPAVGEGASGAACIVEGHGPPSSTASARQRQAGRPPDRPAGRSGRAASR